jgi:hypothetical protein
MLYQGQNFDVSFNLAINTITSSSSGSFSVNNIYYSRAPRSSSNMGVYQQTTLKILSKIK